MDRCSLCNTAGRGIDLRDSRCVCQEYKQFTVYVLRFTVEDCCICMFLWIYQKLKVFVQGCSGDWVSAPTPQYSAHMIHMTVFCYSAALHMPSQTFCLRNCMLRHRSFHPISTIAKPPGVLGVRGHFRRCFMYSPSVTDQSAWHRNATRLAFCEMTGLRIQNLYCYCSHVVLFFNQKYINPFFMYFIFFNKLKHKIHQKVLSVCCYLIYYYDLYYQTACVALCLRVYTFLL